MIKTSLICLAIALALRFAFGQTVEVFNDSGSRSDADWKHAARQVFFAGGVRAERWLTIIRFDTKAPEQRGFDPCFTYAISKARPIVKQLPNGLWQISFTSELTKNLP